MEQSKEENANDFHKTSIENEMDLKRMKDERSHVKDTEKSMGWSMTNTSHYLSCL
jgi:hypothetical protein